MTLHEIASLIHGDVEGDGTVEIRRVAKIEEAGPGDITFLANPKYSRFLSSTKATAVIVGRALSPGEGWPFLVRVDDPYLGFLKVLVKFNPPQPLLPPGIHPSAVVASSAVLAEDVRVGAHVVIGERCHVGARAIIGHGTIIADDVRIGEDTLLYANVTVRERCVVGARGIVHSGTVIGSDGFGFAPRADGTYEKIPQMGIVVVEDDVEIGANCTLDRATLGETRIKKGVNWTISFRLPTMSKSAKTQ
jgi:UDP-3-O-[3-hydroxymyristoyl] glucosamine N-acyltransferase